MNFKPALEVKYSSRFILEAKIQIDAAGVVNKQSVMFRSNPPRHSYIRFYMT
jgi:hypothetical protein